MMTTVSRWSKAALLGGCGLVGVALVVTIAYPSSLSALVHAPERFYTRWFPPPSPPQLPGVSARERAAWRELGSQVSGRIVWSSNRDGNHDLFLVDLTSGAEQRLTDSPHVDFFSRFSPDGTSISFLRSQEPWVSFRDESAWDLYLINADGSGERRLVAGAYHPTWLPDGSGLVYVFENRIYRFDLASGRAEVLHDGRDAPTEGRVHEPELLDDGILAITLRNVPQETVGVLDQQAGVYRPLSSQRACQITWFPGLRRAVWIDPRGNGGTQVMMGRPRRRDRAHAHRSTRRLQPRVLPAHHRQRRVAHLGSSRRRTRTRPGRLRDFRLADRHAVDERNSAHALPGERSMARSLHSGNVVRIGQRRAVADTAQRSTAIVGTAAVWNWRTTTSKNACATRS